MAETARLRRSPTGWWFGTFGLFFHSVGNSNPNWRTHIFHRGRLKPPTRSLKLVKLIFTIYLPYIYHIFTIYLPYIYHIFIYCYKPVAIIEHHQGPPGPEFPLASRCESPKSQAPRTSRFTSSSSLVFVGAEVTLFDANSTVSMALKHG